MINNTVHLPSPALVVISLTGNTERVYPFELLIPVERSGLERDSQAQPQFIRHVSVSRASKAAEPPARRPGDPAVRRLNGQLGME